MLLPITKAEEVIECWDLLQANQQEIYKFLAHSYERLYGNAENNSTIETFKLDITNNLTLRKMYPSSDIVVVCISIRDSQAPFVNKKVYASFSKRNLDLAYPSEGLFKYIINNLFKEEFSRYSQHGLTLNEVKHPVVEFKMSKDLDDLMNTIRAKVFLKKLEET